MKCYNWSAVAAKILKAVSCLCDKCFWYGYETAKDTKKRRSAGQRLKVTFSQFRRSASPGAESQVIKPSQHIEDIIKDRDKILREEDQTIKTTTTSQKKAEGGKGGGGGGGGGKLDKLPEYLRETVDWFMG